MSKPKAKARVFVPLVKVDEEQRLVHGCITQEILDKSNEVMDYESSKPFFEKWSGDIEAASNGLSKGNVRVMHGLTAAGKLTDLQFDDESKSIDVCAKIVDDQEWQKVLEGVYTGFSVGGSYAKRWTDGGVKKYTANPNEVSLVDNPCVPSATFQFTKADGSVEAIPFAVENDDDEWPGFAKADGHTPAPEGEDENAEKPEDKTAPVEKAADGFVPTNAAVAVKAEELQKAAGDMTKDWMDFIPAARVALLEEHNATLGKNADAAPAEGTEAATTEEEGEAAAEPGEAPTGDAEPVAKTTPTGVKQVWTASDGQTFEKKADAEAHEATLEKNAGPESEADRLAKALQRVIDGVEEAEAEAEGEQLFDDLDRVHKAFVELDQPRNEDGSPALEKGMYNVRRFSDVLSDMASLSRSIKAEGLREGNDANDSTVSADIIAAVKTLGQSFISYTTDQVAELLSGMDDGVLVSSCDYYYNAAKDDSENALAKDVAALIDAGKAKMEAEPDVFAKRAPVVIDESEETVPLAKFVALETEQAKLVKIATTAIEQLEGLEKRVKIVEDTPQPRAPNHVVDKAGDTVGPLSKVKTEEEGLQLLKGMLDRHGADNLALMMIKASQTKPQRMGGGQ